MIFNWVDTLLYRTNQYKGTESENMKREWFLKLKLKSCSKLKFVIDFLIQIDWLNQIGENQSQH